jgi:hypothetical protein
MMSSFESTAARPSFSISRISTVRGSRSATKRVSPSSFLAPACAVLASSSILPDRRAFDVHTLRPVTTQPGPSRRAIVSMRLVSVPAFGSVTPNARLRRPRAISGRIRRRRSSLPYRMIGMGGKTAKCTGDAPDSPAPEAQMASSMRTASVTPNPAPPYASGMASPSQPASAKAWTNSVGYSAFRSFSRQ